jgi:hypothetical protein
MPLVFMFANLMVIRHESECGSTKFMWETKKHCKLDKIINIENYNIPEHEDCYCVEDNDSLRMIEEKPSKIVINERLHYMIILNISPFWKNKKIYKIH